MTPEGMLLLAIAFALGVLAGAAVMRLVAAKRERDLRAERARLEGERQEAARRLDGVADELAARSEELSKLKAELAAHEARMAEREAAVEREKKSLTALRGELEEKFKVLADQSFKANQEAFLRLANEVFGKHKTEAGEHLDKHRQAMESLLKPMREHLQALEKSREQEYGALRQELKGVVEAQEKVRSETQRLVHALRAQPKTRGRWGEQQLQNVLELAGMQQHIDFLTQAGSLAEAEDGGRLIPDVIVRLPGGGTIVIDAKTSLNSYLEAVEESDEEAREMLMKKHASEIRRHMDQLASKAYWKNLGAETPDFVAMFVPGDNFFVAAIERDPGLLDDAIRKRVLITTPTTLLALLKAVAWGWRQQQVEENARKVSDLGRELYERIIVMTEHAVRMGKSLGRTVGDFNKFVGSLETRVLTQARRFEELGASKGDRAIPEIEPIDIEPRALRPLPDRPALTGGGSAPADEKGEKHK
ncbi:MAG: DNA recombination protein RmuC [Alphaproteobacteria bacterium]|nr:MAG: DNA recombination protein RmuC [Alphaproteobacteria bacterium]